MIVCSCRSDAIESVLSGPLFPNAVSTKDKVKHWVRVFSGFDKVEVKALEKLLEQKQRFVQNAWFGNWVWIFCVTFTRSLLLILWIKNILH